MGFPLCLQCGNQILPRGSGSSAPRMAGAPCSASPGVVFFKEKMIKMKAKMGFLKGSRCCWGLHQHRLRRLSTRSGKIWSGLGQLYHMGIKQSVGDTPGWGTGDRLAVTPPLRQVWGQSRSGGWFSHLSWVIWELEAEGKP